MENREKIILITGSTGFLGNIIMRRLLDSGYKLRLLIRKRDNDTSENSFGVEGLIKELILGNQSNGYLPGQDSEASDLLGNDVLLYELLLSNVEIYEGDITQNDLGLEREEFRKLYNEVDEVFHCAAMTHFEKQEDNEHIAVNIEGTENILKFVKFGKKKRFHYVSTAYVAGKQNDIIYEHEMLNEPQFNNEYERTKFIAEQTVIKYAKSNDISYIIYRPGIIVGDSKTGATCRFDNFYTFAKVLFNIRNAIIDRKSDSLYGVDVRVSGYQDALINLVPIDYVSDAIFSILNSKEGVGKIFHITNPNPPTLCELRDLLLPVIGLKGLNVKIDDSLEQKQLSTMEKLFIRQTKSYYSYLFSKLRFDCTNTQKALMGTGISCPDTTMELVKVLIDFAVSHNWGDGKRTVLQKA